MTRNHDTACRNSGVSHDHNSIAGSGVSHDHDTIVAPATAAGGAIAVVRVSGPQALTICDRIFRSNHPLAEAAGYTVHYGRIVDEAATPGGLDTLDGKGDGEVRMSVNGDSADGPAAMSGGRVVDEVLATVFRSPHSYTGEDAVEISCHGSQYIVSTLLRLLVRTGARMASPGEFTIRAYLAGKLDLSQAEAVADIIASSSRASHALAINQMRGGYSNSLETLRDKLLNLTSLLELELDFTEEKVEFADRKQLETVMLHIGEQIASLRGSFSLGNALKTGVAVAIVGAPNVGKSTLLNKLVDDDRAMVSDVAGTTRDVIEEHANIDGVLFRFLDTAGIRATDDRLEQMGIERTLSSIARAQVVVYMVDAAGLTKAGAHIVADTESHPGSARNSRSNSGVVHRPASQDFIPDFALRPDQRLILVVNKIDTAPEIVLPAGAIGISARNGDGTDLLRRTLRAGVDTGALYHGDTVVSAGRHHEALSAAEEALRCAIEGLRNGLPADLLSEDIRQVIRHIGTITARGTIVSDEILQNIFSKFCIGK